MNIRIMKFGGTSINTFRKREYIVSLIKETIEQGFNPVIIVSAIGRIGDPYSTDTLLEFLRSNSVNINEHDQALLLSCGEIISSVVISSMLNSAGIKSIALTGTRAGIQTSSKKYINSSITKIHTSCLLENVKKGYIPVIAGFQGHTPEKEVTILSRGGSDTTATALGYTLDAHEIDIFTDVEGIMTTDPAIINEAMVIPQISYKNAYLMARFGAKIINAESIKWAERKGIPINVRMTLNKHIGTKISTCTQDNMRKNNVFAIQYNNKSRKTVNVNILGVFDGNHYHIVEAIKKTLSSHLIPILQVIPKENVISIKISTSFLFKTLQLLHRELIEHNYTAEGTKNIYV
ncbi:aspartate kinase [Bacillus thuringiensis]|uniref:amino acid kinase family protein n=1 Tax=Bacillus thuringiensis TaxID=1428 RepID=UPI000BFA07FD|nr:aspartate kinase [Bacillus thuringiensis]PFF59237.1 aspartate kinase [Bacillus thuringiensis]PGQ37148.1 aspartate kinase [Bacillus thuringiensis]